MILLFFTTSDIIETYSGSQQTQDFSGAGSKNQHLDSALCETSLMVHNLLKPMQRPRSKKRKRRFLGSSLLLDMDDRMDFVVLIHNRTYSV